MEPHTTPPQADDVHVYYAAPDETPSEAVVRAVVTASGGDLVTDAERLPALYGAVDPDALDTLLGSSASSDAAAVRFSYSGYDITVDGSGAVTLVEA